MEQIKPTELRAEDVRVGNYLKGYLTGQPIKVDWLVIKHLLDGNILSLYAPDKPAYEPIPLTEEVLRAAGFEDWGKKQVNELETEWTFAQYNIIEGTSSLLVCLVESKYDGGIYKEWVLRIDHDTVYTKELAYLHQLQNLYFALTGSELEVSLPLIGNSPITDNK